MGRKPTRESAVLLALANDGSNRYKGHLEILECGVHVSNFPGKSEIHKELKKLIDKDVVDCKINKTKTYRLIPEEYEKILDILISSDDVLSFLESPFSRNLLKNKGDEISYYILKKNPDATHFGVLTNMRYLGFIKKKEFSIFEERVYLDFLHTRLEEIFENSPSEKDEIKKLLKEMKKVINKISKSLP